MNLFFTCGARISLNARVTKSFFAVNLPARQRYHLVVQIDHHRIDIRS